MTHLHLSPETGDAIILHANSQRAWPLFAEILNERSKPMGVAPVRMARVAQGWKLGLAVTVFAALATLLQALWLVFGAATGQRELRWPTR